MNNRYFIKRLAVLLMFFIVQHKIANGQELGTCPFVLGVTDNIVSKELDEKRELNIYLPDGYKQDTATRYQVIYLLDGSAEEDFVHIVGVVQFLTMIGEMPKTIVVGIANVDRRRDFTFPTSIDSDKKAYPTTGGSKKFISFIEKELQPYIQSKYRTNTSKTIIGQSLGGLLATEILMEKPKLFNTYIIVSPSLWWDHESLLAKAPGSLKSLPAGDMNVYVSVGSEGKIMESDANELVADLKNCKQKHLKIYFEPMPEEDHLTILHRCIYKALEVLNGKSDTERRKN